MAGHACRSAQDVYRLRPSDCIGIIRGRSVYHHQRLRDHARFSSRLVAPLLTNPLVLYLGRISYSLYLSHILVIIVIQYALLTWVPDLSRTVHFGVLLVCTTAVTIAVSTVLYRYLEVPGIHAGRFLARRLAAQWEAGTQDAIVFPRETEFNPVRPGYPTP